ncbi:MAG: GFA family protein [Dokdonella sp.]|uniref:GFA family protein n=1 Tax=Dokdonella sp. TaxID=2291710 RepID=UPI0025C499CE|nr:GFA family protein [Dokdonella sp.]MBZ0222992.1 GFA family protein [Dokdonella sp.]MCC7256423.1 GFA family protein [Dokdonella sp.]
MTLSLSCRCGASRIIASGMPVMRAYCHSQACRDLFGGAATTMTTWRRGDVEVPAGARPLATYKHTNHNTERHFCATCGDVLFAVDALGFRLIPGATLAHASHGSLPERFAPTMHVNYAQRQFDIADNLPKYLERPGGPLHDSLRAVARVVRQPEIPLSMQQVRSA